MKLNEAATTRATERFGPEVPWELGSLDFPIYGGTIRADQEAAINAIEVPDGLTVRGWAQFDYGPDEVLVRVYCLKPGAE